MPHVIKGIAPPVTLPNISLQTPTYILGVRIGCKRQLGEVQYLKTHDMIPEIMLTHRFGAG